MDFHPMAAHHFRDRGQFCEMAKEHNAPGLRGSVTLHEMWVWLPQMPVLVHT
jgi:hypothetical protein